MYIFEIPEDKIKELEEWKKHKCKFKDPSKQGAIGGRFTYKFTPTSLGVLIDVRCACGNHINLTDVDNF